MFALSKHDKVKSSLLVAFYAVRKQTVQNNIFFCWDFSFLNTVAILFYSVCVYRENLELKQKNSVTM